MLDPELDERVRGVGRRREMDRVGSGRGGGDPGEGSEQVQARGDGDEPANDGKEMRFSAAGGEWRVAFAFDPVRRAVLLVAGDKSGGSQRRFYRALIAKADERFDRHLARLAEEGGSQ